MNAEQYRKNDMKNHDLRTYQMMNLCLRIEPLMPQIFFVKQTLALMGLFETIIFRINKRC